jgi:hypothetical protein
LANDELALKNFPSSLDEYERQPSTKFNFIIALTKEIGEFNKLVDLGRDPPRSLYSWDNQTRQLVDAGPLPAPNKTPNPRHIKIIIYMHWVILFPMLERVSRAASRNVFCLRPFPDLYTSQAIGHHT